MPGASTRCARGLDAVPGASHRATLARLPATLARHPDRSRASRCHLAEHLAHRSTTVCRPQQVGRPRQPEGLPIGAGRLLATGRLADRSREEARSRTTTRTRCASPLAPRPSPSPPFPVPRPSPPVPRSTALAPRAPFLVPRSSIPLQTRSTTPRQTGSTAATDSFDRPYREEHRRHVSTHRHDVLGQRARAAQ